MMIRRWIGVPALAGLALVLMAAGPSVGDRIAEGQTSAPPTPPPMVPCQDDSAVLVTARAEGVLFRCVGGVPVPRQGPWSMDDCAASDYEPEAVFAVGPGATWPPSTACLIAVPSNVVPAVGPETQHAGR